MSSWEEIYEFPLDIVERVERVAYYKAGEIEELGWKAEVVSEEDGSSVIRIFPQPSKVAMELVANRSLWQKIKNAVPGVPAFPA